MLNKLDPYAADSAAVESDKTLSKYVGMAF